jgi:hypothetical protein
MDLASPKLAESAGISLEASEKLWYDSIKKLTIHLFKYLRAGFKKIRYMERFLFIGVNTSGKAGAQIPQRPLGDDSSPWGR